MTGGSELALTRQESEINALVKQEAQAAGDYESLVVFQLAGQEYGLAAVDVREIAGRRPITRVPHAPRHIEGVINLRGRIIPVFNLRRKLGKPEIAGQQAERQAVMVVNAEDGEAGILVDQVADVVKLSKPKTVTAARQAETAPETGFIERRVELPGRTITILKTKTILED